MDLVLNHSSYEHPYFQDALANKNSKYREYYRFEDGDNEDYNFKKQAWESTRTRAKYSKYFDSTFNFDVADSGILNMVKNETCN